MIPLFRSEQVRNADNYAINKLKIPGIVLMENASLSIFHSILEIFPEINTLDTIGIIAGKGNNGGDGFAVARQFINSGFQVKVISLGKESELKGDALINYQILKNLVMVNRSSSLVTYKSLNDLKVFKQCNFVLDAILGTGTKGILKEPLNKIVSYLNDLDAIRVSIDIPTGLDVDSGYTENSFHADMTVSLAELKRELFFNKGYVNAGEVVKGSIGLGDEYFREQQVDEYLVEPEDAAYGLPEKRIDDHKYSAGKVLTIAGSGEMPGAAFFTANTINKAGAGASFLAFPNSLKRLAQQKLDGSIVHSFNDEESEILAESNFDELKDKLEWANAIAIGPGLGRNEETLNAVQKILKKFKNKKIVIDADGLSALKDSAYQKIDLKNKVLTPHHKEFADMIGIEISELEKDMLEIGRKFVAETKCYLVLKGAPTLIFNPEGEVFINSTGNEGMAKFGSGDVLTGIITSLLAQTDDIESAVITSVYLHGLSADLLLESKTEYGMTASDIMNNIPAAINFLRNSIV